MTIADHSLCAGATFASAIWSVISFFAKSPFGVTQINISNVVLRLSGNVAWGIDMESSDSPEEFSDLEMAFLIALDTLCLRSSDLSSGPQSARVRS